MAAKRPPQRDRESYRLPKRDVWLGSPDILVDNARPGASSKQGRESVLHRGKRAATGLCGRYRRVRAKGVRLKEPYHLSATEGTSERIANPAHPCWHPDVSGCPRGLYSRHRSADYFVRSVNVTRERCGWQ